MYITVWGILVMLTAAGIWHVLRKYTRLSLPVRILLTVLLAVLAAVVLVWASVWASILLYQLTDPISW